MVDAHALAVVAPSTTVARRAPIAEVRAVYVDVRVLRAERVDQRALAEQFAEHAALAFRAAGLALVVGVQALRDPAARRRPSQSSFIYVVLPLEPRRVAQVLVARRYI